MATFYKHSGAAPLGGVIKMVFAGLATASTLAFIYSYSVVWIPIIYVNLLLTAGFGYVIGMMVSRAARASHLRNVAIPVLVGFVSGCVGLYIAWGVDYAARAGWPDEEVSRFIVFHPLVILEYVSWFYENGAWSIGKDGGNVSGIPLAIVWLIEGGVIVGLATYASYSGLASLAYCETCSRWTNEEPNIKQLSADTLDERLPLLLEGDLRGLKDWTFADPAALRFVQVSLFTCDSCIETNYLSLDLAEIKIDKNNERSVTTTPVLKKLAISETDVELVRATGVMPEPPVGEDASLENIAAAIDPALPEDDFLRQISAK